MKQILRTVRIAALLLVGSLADSYVQKPPPPPPISQPGSPFVVMSARGQELPDPMQRPPPLPPSAAALTAGPPQRPKRRWPWRSSGTKTSVMRRMGDWGSVRDSFKHLVALILIAGPLEQLLSTTKLVTDRDLQRFISKTIAGIVWVLLGTSLLGTLGFDTKPLVAGIGVSGFLVGFTLKEVATNLLSGILLVLQRPFRTGWSIKVGSHSGTVRSIDSRYVRLETADGTLVLIPSYQVYTAAVTIVDTKPRSSSAAQGSTSPATETPTVLTAAPTAQTGAAA